MGRMLGQKIVFLHIPKTAGSSLHEVLKQGRNAVQFTNGDINDFNAYMALDLSGIDLISGHLQLQNLLRRDLSTFRFVTVLRDPIEREISTYRYILSWPKHPLHERFNGCTFEQFVEKTADARNLQCRFFSGKPNADAAISAIQDRFDVVGTAEDMPLFMSALGIEAELPRANKTVSDVSVEISDDYREYLRLELAEDYRLFSFVSPVWTSSETRRACPRYAQPPA